LHLPQLLLLLLLQQQQQQQHLEVDVSQEKVTD
jgi:hypothetical protein